MSKGKHSKPQIIAAMKQVGHRRQNDSDVTPIPDGRRVVSALGDFVKFVCKTNGCAGYHVHPPETLFVVCEGESTESAHGPAFASNKWAVDDFVAAESLTAHKGQQAPTGPGYQLETEWLKNE
jgi:hypothetical protein